MRSGLDSIFTNQALNSKKLIPHVDLFQLSKTPVVIIMQVIGYTNLLN